MAPVISNVLLVGNSGVGKSYLLNSVGGNFKSGFNIVDGLTTEISYCDVTIGGATVRLIDVPGLLEATDEKVAQNAVAITKALRMKGGFKLILVLPECAGRIQPSDLYTIGKVLSSIGFSIDVGLIINKVHEDDLENYADSGVRNDVLNKLNTLAEGKIKGSWFTVIPRFGKNNPTGAGKSYLLNSIGGNFRSGFSAVDGLTTECTCVTVNLQHEPVQLIDAPGLLEATGDKMLNNARAIADALRIKGRFKVIFVLADCSGRVQPSELYVIGKVMTAIDFSIEVGVIINKVPEDYTDFYKNPTAVQKIIKELNTAANGKINQEWFQAIPRFRKNNQKGAAKPLEHLLSRMEYQDIPVVKDIVTSVPELNEYIDLVRSAPHMAMQFFKTRLHKKKEPKSDQTPDQEHAMIDGEGIKAPDNAPAAVPVNQNQWGGHGQSGWMRVDIVRGAVTANNTNMDDAPSTQHSSTILTVQPIDDPSLELPSAAPASTVSGNRDAPIDKFIPPGFEFVVSYRSARHEQLDNYQYHTLLF
ncbi:hypothetical protein BGZ73_005628 [Actinomortierella ambigua]|nr:hypothetical protein BGZ73_005628 [Actinomortierella ambigua]